MAETAVRQRSIAVKIRIRELLDSRYVKEEGWTPNYIVTKQNKEVMRLNVIGTVVDKSEQPVTLIIDDGSGSIKCRNFDGPDLSVFNVADVVQIIGKPREFGPERYILVELIKKVDPLWASIRRAELAREKSAEKTDSSEQKAGTAQQDQNNRNNQNIDSETLDFAEEIVVSDPSSLVVDYITGNDKGDGVDIDELILKVNVDNGERIIRTLLEEGEIFEVRPGRVKVL